MITVEKEWYAEWQLNKKNLDSRDGNQKIVANQYKQDKHFSYFL